MFFIDIRSRTAVYTQLIEQVQRFILSGILSEGEQMPSVRSLSADLSINPNTIQKAYTELDRMGLIRSVPGRGCFITQNAKEIVSGIKSNKLNDLDILVKELKMAGITKDKILECVERSYDND